MQLKRAKTIEPGKQYFVQCADGSWSPVSSSSERMLNSSLWVVDERRMSDTVLMDVALVCKEQFVICGDFIGYLTQKPIRLLDGKYMIMNETGVLRLTGSWVEVLNEVPEEYEDDLVDEDGDYDYEPD